MEEIRGKACACKDAACVEAALQEMSGIKPPGDERRAQRLAAEILSCVAKVGAMEPEAVETEDGAGDGDGDGEKAEPKPEAAGSGSGSAATPSAATPSAATPSAATKTKK